MKFLIALVLTLAVACIPANVVAIVKGYNDPDGCYQYVALLKIKYHPAALLPSISCTGTYIGNNWTLTAAHCLATRNPLYPTAYETKVYMGSSIRYQGVAAYGVKCVFYKHFNFTNEINDFALLNIVFNMSINPTNYPKPATLPAPYLGDLINYENSIVQSVGWGYLEKNATSDATYLQYGWFSGVSNIYCEDRIKRKLNADQFCVQDTVASLCSGDSGGPVILEPYGYLIGVVSYGVQGSCSPTFPTVITRMNSKYLNWIANITRI